MGANRKREYIESGTKIGFLTVISYVQDRVMSSGAVRRRVLVKCDCGVVKEVDHVNLIGTRAIQSCGCKTKETKQAKMIDRERKEAVYRKRLAEAEERKRKIVERKVVDFHNKMRAAEDNCDVETLINETRRFLYSGTNMEYFYYEQDVPITVGNFVIDDNVSKFDENGES